MSGTGSATAISSESTLRTLRRTLRPIIVAVSLAAQ